MKILYLSDTQFRATSPASRRDDFMATAMRKVAELSGIVSEEEVDALVHGGDFFDDANVPYRVTDAVAEAWLMDKKDGERVPTYVNAGNHDLWSYRVDTIPRSALGMLLHFDGFVVMADMLAKPRAYCPTTTLRWIGLTRQHRILLAATPYVYGVEDLLAAFSFKRGYEYPPFGLKAGPGDIVIHVTHGTIVPEPFPFAPHVLTDDLAKVTEANVVLCGHWHKPWGTITYPSGLQVVNPGSFLRMSVQERHQPAVALLEVTQDGQVKIRFRELRSAEPADVVFREGEIKDERMDDGEVRALLDHITETARGLDVGHGVESLVRAAAEATQARPEVLERALELVGGTE